MKTEDPSLSTREIAKVLSVNSHATVARWIKTNELTRKANLKKRGRQRKLTPEQVNEVIRFIRISFYLSNYVRQQRNRGNAVSLA